MVDRHTAGLPAPPGRLWLGSYDWTAAAAKLNRHPHAIAEVGGKRLHFVRAGRPDHPAIVLLHGWPYTFAEMLPVADRLAADFFVIVPSLPGFAYSDALDVPFSDVTVAPLIQALMTGVLGVDRYLTYGEDVGTRISDRLAATYPESVAGIAVTHAAFPPEERKHDLAPEEQHFYRWLEEWDGVTGYAQLQATKPDTLAAALTDSPAGLASWMVEKFRGWSDCDGDVETVFSMDALLTTVMLYWTTQSIATSFRPYADGNRIVGHPRLDIVLPEIDVSAGIATQRHERTYPRALAERTYRDIRCFSHLRRGGHFTATEAPDAVASLVRDLHQTM